MSEIKEISMDSLNDKSETITDSLENIEEELNLGEDSEKISDDLRTAYLKINSLSRSDSDNSELEKSYLSILDKYDKLGESKYSTKKEYLEATKSLLSDLGNLENSSGYKLGDSDIDGGFFEAGIALKDGVVKAGETIADEIKGYFEMAGMAGELPAILEKVWDSLSMETFSDIYDALVDMGGDVIRDFNLILDNATTTGKAVELSNFIPAIGIPLLFESVGPGKFLKILKLDKLIPEKVIGAMEGTLEKGKEVVGKVADKGKEMGSKIAENMSSGNNSMGMNTQLGYIGNKPDTSISNKNKSPYESGKIDKTDGKGFDSDTVRDNFNISSNVNRKESAVKILKEKYGDEFKGLSEKQLDGIIDSHEIGKELFEKYLKENGINSVADLSDKQLREIFNSKEGRIALRQKMKKLKEVGVDLKYSDDLIRSGITGGVDFGDKIIGKELAESFAKKSEMILSNLDELPNIMSRIKKGELLANDKLLLGNLSDLAEQGSVFNSKINTDIKKLVSDLNSSDVVKVNSKVLGAFNLEGNKDILNSLKSGDYSNIPGLGQANDLYKKIDDIIGNIDLSSVDKIDGVIKLSADEIGKVQEVMGDLLKIDFNNLFKAGINSYSIKPLQAIMKYGGVDSEQGNKLINTIIEKVKKGDIISNSEGKFLTNINESIRNDPRLKKIKNGKLDDVNISTKVEKVDTKIKIDIADKKINGAIESFGQIKSEAMSLFSSGKDRIKKIFSDGNKGVFNELLEIKDDLYDTLDYDSDNIGELSNLLHNNNDRVKKLKDLGFSQSEISILDDACLI